MNHMDENKCVRKSERSNKGMPQRFGFYNDVIQNQSDGAANSSLTDTLVRADNIVNQKPRSTKSVTSKANTRVSKQSSIREIEHLKKTLAREKELHKIDMLQLEKKKEFLLKSLTLEKKLKEKQDEISNNSDDDNPKSEINSQRKEDVREWLNQVPSFQPFGQTENIPRFINRIHRQRNAPLESTRLNSGAESNSQEQNDVLIAAFKALQIRELKDLPTFNGGNVLEWPNFISEFKRSTEEFDIKPNKNLRRLNKALEGDARSSVQTLLSSPDNIKEIISHLQMSFGRPEWILQHLIADLRSLSIMKNGDIHQSKMFYNTLFGAITTIRNMRQEAYLTNPELLACLEEKLPTITRHQWIRYKADLIRKRNNIDIYSLGEWFKYELDAQFAGLSAKDIINYSHTTSGWTEDDNYIPDGKEFP